GLSFMLVSGVQAQSAVSEAAAATAGAATPMADTHASNVPQVSLQEVVVTAERRSESLQKTPIVITAITGEQVRTKNINNVSDLQSFVPAFQVSDLGGFHDYINIRGMGNSAILSTTIASGVPLLRDGVLINESVALDEPMFDVADVEVLEGPQGTFVGANSTAGAVEINSANPDFRGVTGYVSGGVGTYSATKWEGAVNVPVTDTFAVRIAFTDQQRNSFFKDIGSQYSPGTGNSSTDPGHEIARAARVSLLWRPTDNFQALGKIEYSYLDTGGTPGEPNPYTYDTLFAAGPGVVRAPNAGCSVSGSQLLCPGAGVTTHSPYYYPGERPFVLNYYDTNQAYNEVFSLYSLELRERLQDGIVLRALSGVVHVDVNENAENSFGPLNGGNYYSTVGPNNNAYEQELDVISPTGGKVNWVVGGFGYYYHLPLGIQNQTVTPPYTPGAPASTVLLYSSVSTSRMAAVFGQLNWNVFDSLQLQVGARENWDNNFVDNAINPAPVPGTVLSMPDGTGVYAITYPPGSTNPSSYRVVTDLNAQGRYRDSVPTGKAGLSWNPLPGQNFYAFYARGYKSGGANQTSTDHPTFAPEHVNDYEVGWKGTLFGGHMRTQAGGYYINYQGMQYPIFDANEGNDTTVGDVTENLAASTIYGIQVAEQSRFGGLGVDLAFDYNHSALGSILAVPDYQLPPNFNTPIAHPQCYSGARYPAGVTCFNYDPYLVNLKGEANPYSPLITGNVGIDYRFHVGGSVLDPRVSFSHTDRQWDSIFQDSRYNLMPARNLWDASVSWMTGEWIVRIYGTNLTNRTYIIAGGNPTIYYGAPRQEGIQVTYHFGQ
ncbi:MAG: TonB-dependent receptor, partial [Acetobacteraceae bacterium]